MNKWLKGIAAIIVVGAPTLAVQAQEASASNEVDVTMQESHGVRRWKNSSGVSSFNIELRGKVEVTDDDKDIKSLSNDGYLKITKTVFGSKREIVIESLGGGKIRKEYTEGRTKMSWDPQGKDLLGEILPDIVRSTTLAAEGRVNRIFQQGGSAGILAELHKIESDYVKGHYAKLLLEKSIPAAELPRVITTISEVIGSDYYLSKVYQGAIGKLLSTPEAADAFFRGTKSIGSDYYKSVVLKEALKKFPASPAQVKVILQSAATMESDYYLSVVLTTLLEENDVKPESLDELVLVSQKIPSDYYRTQVLRKALAKSGLQKNTLKKIVDALASVDSDYYKTAVFNSMADQSAMDADVQLQVINLIGKSVDSDYYAANSLKAILEHQKLSDASFKELVSVAGKMESSNYASEVLRSAAKNDLTKNQLFDILKASEQVNSDYYRSQVLIALADQVKSADSGVKDAYRQAAKGISSETYYGKTLKAIDN